METLTIFKSIVYFLITGLFEIGWGDLIRLWIREGKPLSYAVLGAVVLTAYGIIPIFKPANFSRVYAAYGGVFIVLSIFAQMGILRLI